MHACAEREREGDYVFRELFIKVVLLFNFYIVWCVELRLDAREYFTATYRLLSTFIAAAVGRFPADIRGTTKLHQDIHGVPGLVFGTISRWW